jgi:sulfur-carrier protein adenylyltransferase/sulfurtransferase
VVPGIMGMLQANETLKLLLGIGDPLVGRLLLFDALETTFEELMLRRDPDCRSCGDAARAAGYPGVPAADAPAPAPEGAATATFVLPTPDRI